MPIDDVRFLATAILLQKETGGNLALILDKTASVMRERSRLRGQLRIYTAQGRITGWILCFAPFVLFGLINITNRNYERALFTTPMGLHMVYGALGGSLFLLHAAQAYAGLKARTYVLPDDVKQLAAAVLAHRIILRPEARMKLLNADLLIEEIMKFGAAYFAVGKSPQLEYPIDHMIYMIVAALG